MGNPLTVDYAPGTQIPLALFQGVPLNVIVGTAGGVVDATAVTYTPGDVLDWTIPPPANVQDALDQLANVRGSYTENPSALVAATTQTLSLGSVTPSKSGIYLAWGCMELNGSGPNAGVASLQFLVDSVSHSQPNGMGYTVGARTLTLSTFALIAVNRAIAHNWALLGDSGSADAFGVAQQRAKLMILEL